MSRTIERGDVDYPQALAALANPPTLYVRGELPRARGVAIVGTRKASPEALLFTKAIVEAVAAEGFAVWSGGAHGIDGAAHEAAVAAHAPTVAVLGGGLDRIYPPDHAPLFAEIVRGGGALVALVPDDVPARPSGFFRRNGVLSAATDATVVVEAGYASGARNTAKAARRLGRPLCVVPHAPWSERGQGCALELAMGARAVSAPRDVLVALGHVPERARAPRGRAERATGRPPTGTAFLHPDEALDATEVAVLAVLSGEPLHIDLVCERTALPLPRVAGALLTLTLKAVVVEEPAGSFRRASSFV